MPEGLTKFLTRAELIDLVRFLSELGKPGPYAVRKTPTIQRWRVLQQLPENLTGAEVDPDLLREELQSLGDNDWIPLYAKVAGGLPISEIAQNSKLPLLILQAEIDVTAGGEVGVMIEVPLPYQAAIDDEPLRTDKRFTVNLSPGQHVLTVFINFEIEQPGDLRVELFRVDGSKAEFQVVGGR